MLCAVHLSHRGAILCVDSAESTTFAVENMIDSLEREEMNDEDGGDAVDGNRLEPESPVPTSIAVSPRISLSLLP